ncbi:hypothetical protein B5S28_g1317 [[Candida] boidinii]|nr:hypothetical protein B5S28_g1317 [[Candida] boidinii]
MWPNSPKSCGNSITSLHSNNLHENNVNSIYSEDNDESSSGKQSSLPETVDQSYDNDVAEVASTQQEVDVLPSFEMHNYMFNRRLDEKSINLDSLPQYDEISRCMTNRSRRLAAAVTNTAISEGQAIMNEDIVADNFDKLQNADAPLDIKFTLTKKVDSFMKPAAKESPFREYHPGDIVTGNVIVENKSDRPLQFEMLLVSLEGEMQVPKKLDNGKLGYVKKTFLRTYDIRACFHLASIDHVEYCKQIDVDGAQIGFAGSAILPGVRHKKFFYFKLPNELLDNICEEELLHHFIDLPPSFGNSEDGSAINPSSSIHLMNNKKTTIDKNTGYGLNPSNNHFITNDLNPKGVSVSYSVNLRVITRRDNYFKQFLGINPPRNGNYSSQTPSFIMAKEFKNYIRFMPLEGAPDAKHKHLEKTSSTSSQLQKILNQADSLASSLKKRKELIGIGVVDEDELSKLQEELESDISIKKGVHSITSVRSSTSISSRNSDLNEMLMPPSEINPYSRSLQDVRIKRLTQLSTFDVIKKNMIHIWKKPNFSFIKEVIHTGELNVIPLNIDSMARLPVTGTKNLNTLIRCSNHRHQRQQQPEGSNDSPTGSTTPSLNSVNSNNPESRSASTTESSLSISNIHRLDTLELELKYYPYADNSKKPDLSQNSIPDIVSIKPVLRCFTLFSETPIPVNIDHEFLFPSPNFAPKSKFNVIDNSMKICKRTNEVGNLAKETKAKISKQFWNTLISFGKIQYDEKSLDIFNEHKFTDDSSSHIQWELKQENMADHKSSIDEIFDTTANDIKRNQVQMFVWKAKIKIPLNIIEQDLNNAFLVPDFESCHVVRKYALELKFEFKKHTSQDYTYSIPVRLSRFV